MWEEAVSSGARVTEVRAAQFYGKGVVSEFGLLVQPQVLSGALALVPRRLDVPHSFSAIGDVARTLGRRHQGRSGCVGPGVARASCRRSRCGLWRPGWPTSPARPRRALEPMTDSE
ncbi:hypothetical protein [Nonomuraea dietziae]|uniref:hypothetical protein n=1 Tax=Nonomuraea dietziae TaxID=65515 RepID=UPI0031D5CD15